MTTGSTADVIVVGAGVVGLAICRRLLEAGLAVTCIDDPDGVVSSASYASGAMLGALGEVSCTKDSPLDRIETEMRLRAADVYPPWLSTLAAGRVEITAGTFVIANASGLDDVRNLEHIASVAARSGRRHEWVDPRDIPGLVPHRSMPVVKALYLPDEGSLDSGLLMQELHAHVRQHVRFTLVQKKVSRLIVTSERVSGVATSDGSLFSCDGVFLCAGAATTVILESSALPATGVPAVFGGKGSSVSLDSSVVFPSCVRTPNRDFACGLHVVPRGGRQIYVGATNRLTELSEVVQGATVGELHTQLHAVTHQINVGLRNAVLGQIRYGSRPYCADGYPVFGTTQVPGLCVATGTYRNGVLLAPLIARIAVDEWLAPSSTPNVFSARARASLHGPASVEGPLVQAVEDLVSFILEPHGSLPYNRAHELADFITAILTAKSDPGGEEDAEVARFLQDFSVFPAGERLPLLYYRLHDLYERRRRHPRGDAGAITNDDASPDVRAALRPR